MKTYIVTYYTNYGEYVWVICAENKEKLNETIKHYQNNDIKWGGYTHGIGDYFDIQEIDNTKEGVLFIGGGDG